VCTAWKRSRGCSKQYMHTPFNSRQHTHTLCRSPSPGAAPGVTHVSQVSLAGVAAHLHARVEGDGVVHGLIHSTCKGRGEGRG
jgi:hypothetical protein